MERLSFTWRNSCWVSPHSLLKTWKKENKRTYWAIFLALVSAAAMTCLVEKKKNMLFLENQVPEEEAYESKILLTP